LTRPRHGLGEQPDDIAFLVRPIEPCGAQPVRRAGYVADVNPGSYWDDCLFQ
jgi:hypothetical protein